MHILNVSFGHRPFMYIHSGERLRAWIGMQTGLAVMHSLPTRSNQCAYAQFMSAGWHSYFFIHQKMIAMLNAAHKSYKLLCNHYAIQEQKRYMDMKEHCSAPFLSWIWRSFFRFATVISLDEKISTGNNRWNVSALCMAEPSSLLFLLTFFFVSLFFYGILVVAFYFPVPSNVH